MDSSNQGASKKLTRDFTRYSIITQLNTLIRIVSSILMAKILTNLMTKSEYGYFSIGRNLFTFILAFSITIFTNALWRYYEDVNWGKQEKTGLLSASMTYSTFLILLSGSGLVFIYLIFDVALFSKENYLEFLVLVILISLMQVAPALVASTIRAKMDSKEAFPFDLGLILLPIFFCVFLAVFISSSSETVLVGFFLAGIILTGFSIILRRGIIDFRNFDRKYLRLSLRFGLPLMISSAILSLLPLSLLLLTEYHLGVEIVAMLSIALFVSNFYQRLTQGVMKSYMPYIVRSFEEGDSAINRKATRIIELFLLFSFLIIIWLISLSSILIETVSNRDYVKDASVIFPYLLLGHFFLGLSKFTSVGLVVKERPELEAIAYSITFLASIILLIFLFPAYGLISAGFGFLFFFFSVFILGTILGNWLFPLQVEKRTLLRLSLVIGLPLITYLLLIHQSLIIAILVASSLNIVLIFALGYQKEFRSVLRHI